MYHVQDNIHYQKYHKALPTAPESNHQALMPNHYYLLQLNILLQVMLENILKNHQKLIHLYLFIIQM